MIVYSFQDDCLEVNGHANYALYGSDIVCAAVSTAIYMTINLIERFNLEKDVVFKIEEGDFYLKINSLSANLKNIIDNLVLTLNDLKIQYPKNVKERND